MARPKKELVHAQAPEYVDIAAIRERQGLSQSEFAARYGIPLRTLQGWEISRRQPDEAARVLLAVIDKEPKAVVRALRG